VLDRVRLPPSPRPTSGASAYATSPPHPLVTRARPARSASVTAWVYPAVEWRHSCQHPQRLSSARPAPITTPPLSLLSPPLRGCVMRPGGHTRPASGPACAVPAPCIPPFLPQLAHNRGLAPAPRRPSLRTTRQKRRRHTRQVPRRRRVRQLLLHHLPERSRLRCLAGALTRPAVVRNRASWLRTHCRTTSNMGTWGTNNALASPVPARRTHASLPSTPRGRRPAQMAVVADWATAWQRPAMASPSVLSRACRPSTRAAPWACASACVEAWMAVASTSARAPPSGLRWTHQGNSHVAAVRERRVVQPRRVAERLHAGRQVTAAQRQHPQPLLAARYRGAAPSP
jgi:hypothetical protein